MMVRLSAWPIVGRGEGKKAQTSEANSRLEVD